MSTWVYVAWFQSLSAEPDDEDNEWVAVLSISAETADQAKSWGDHLAKKRASRDNEDKFLWSEIHMPSDPTYRRTGIDELPLVVDGVETEDSVIGW
jgi:hypothetical protein